VANVYEIFSERGFIEQVTDEELIKDLLQRESVTCYIGFDPTAASLHVGSLVPIMALSHMQRAGHRPIALVGGGTALIGDPSGKTEMRQILTRDEINSNARGIQKQLSRYIDFTGDKAMLVNNADWLSTLNYIEFLRDIGRHFSVNRMLAAESYRMRMETGLNFIEFNYMLLQSYDFYYLCKHYGCVMQMGGNDQWGNIVAGVDLTRRLEGKRVYGLTFPLLVTSQGHKMGKTEKGTIWLDPERTSPYEYFQYWINTEDADVRRFMALFTFLPMDEIDKVSSLVDAQINMAKTVLAFEATKITHGEEEAVAAWKASAGAFNVRPVSADLFPSSSIPRTGVEQDVSAIPTYEKSMEEVQEVPIAVLFQDVHLCTSKGEARRLITQGGAYVNGRQIASIDETITADDVNERREIHLRKGKKKYAIIKVR
jgi:tyrosyl-tRNA synthetase